MQATSSSTASELPCSYASGAIAMALGPKMVGDEEAKRSRYRLITCTTYSCLEQLDVCVEQVPLCDMDALHAQLMNLQIQMEGRDSAVYQ
jgi:hypothetical protein